MATITTGSPSFYFKGNSGASAVAGYETANKRTRVVRYQFKTTSIGASSVSWNVSGLIKGEGTPALRWYIGTSDTSHVNACEDSSLVVSISSNTSASGSASMILQPNTTYYLWIYPATTISGYIHWNKDPISINVVGSESSWSLSTTSVEVGKQIAVNISQSSSSFKHTVEFYINSTYYQKYTDVNTSQSFTIPSSWYNYMSTTTECSAYCKVTTYNGNTQIGSATTKTFTVKVPASVTPTVGTISFTTATYNILVKGKNQLTVSVSDCNAGNGSTIKSYTFSGPSISKTVSSSNASASVSSSSVSDVGSLTYKVTVTDARGRTASKTETITCYDYYLPSIKNFKTYRCDASKNPDNKGSYLTWTYAEDYASVNGTNSVTVTVYYSDGSTSKEATNNPINVGTDFSKTYKVYAKIVDAYGGSSTTDTGNVFGEARIFNITSDGTGIAIGKMAEETKLFECRWDARFDQYVSGPHGFSTSSDIRVKENIEDISIDVVDKLRPIQYTLTRDTDGKIHYGFIAQDIETLWNSIGLNPNSFGIIGQINNSGAKEYVLTYTEFIPLLTKKCQYLQNEIDELRLEIKNLKNTMK